MKKKNVYTNRSSLIVYLLLRGLVILTAIRANRREHRAVNRHPAKNRGDRFKPQAEQERRNAQDDDHQGNGDVRRLLLPTALIEGNLEFIIIATIHGAHLSGDRYEALSVIVCEALRPVFLLRVVIITFSKQTVHPSKIQQSHLGKFQKG